MSNMIPRFLSILAVGLIPVWLFAAPIAGNSVTFDGLQNGEPVRRPGVTLTVQPA